MDWLELSAAFAVFFLTHSVPIRPPTRPWLEAHLGARGFTLAYSALSLASLVWLIAAAARAPYAEIWPQTGMQTYVPLVIMLAVCMILALSLGRPNPFSFGGSRNEAFDPARPGLVRFTRHPLLVAIGLWAVAHIFPNGDLAHVLLFGTFALFALFGGQLIDHRKRREMGADWAKLQSAVRQAPLLTMPLRSFTLGLRLTAGVILYVGLIGLHPVLFGASPLPN